MTAEADVIRLVQRADWTRLSLAAEANDGSRVLIAPGRRYREQTPARGGSRRSQQGLRGCDGERSWSMPAPDEDRNVHWIEGPRPPLPMLLCPGWLLRSSRLEVRGHVTTRGRDALHVVATERPSFMDPIRLIRLRPGRTEALVDAELGILLRVAWLPPEDEPPDVTELVSLEVDPVIDPAQFAPPPGSIVTESWGEALAAGGPAFAIAKTAAGLAAGGLGVLIKYWPLGRARAESDPEDAEAAMPQDDPAPEMSPDGHPAGPEVGDEVLQLLHDSGTAAFGATLHEWSDISAMLSQVPESVRRTGFGGLGMLVSALTERGDGGVHLVSALRVGGPGQYQIDHHYDPEHGPKTIACDGQRRWQVYDDNVTVGPARLSPGDIGDLADASWLLECRISGGALIMAGDRPAYRIHAARGNAPLTFSMMFPAAVAVVDAELSIVLSLTSFLGGKPVRRYELRDVTATRADEFRVNVPSGLRVEPDRWADAENTDPSHLGSLPLKVAGAVAREVSREATRAARKFLRRFTS
jgi:hypothetical protein